MPTFIDQMNRTIELAHPPRRIISLVPSQTELLCDLGLADSVVGITKFCVHPKAHFKAKPRVGGTKSYHFDKIADLQPDLIIGNKEENDQAQVEQLMEQYPVWMSDIATLDDARQMIAQIGEITETQAQAQALNQQINTAFAALEPPSQVRKAAYLIWHEPMMVAGQGTFINEMMRWAGLTNVIDNKTRYPALSIEELQAAQPSVILLSSEPFPFKAKHIAYFKEICPAADVRLVDGEVFSWYGSRLLHAAPYFRNLRSELHID